MRIVDLGDLPGRVVVFGGPYSNLQATEALLQVAGDAALICTGDIVAYGADPAACVELVRNSGAAVIAGNCERQLAAGAMDCGCGFDDGSTCDRLSAAWFAHADQQTDADARAWMNALPDIATFAHAGRRFAVIHGGVTDIARFLWPCSPRDAFAEEISCLERHVGPIDAVIAGHSGIAFQRDIPISDTCSIAWINAGAIGLPPHDDRPLGRYVTLEDGRVFTDRLNYDQAAAHAAMTAAGLTQGYHDTMLTGRWPSEDVLPSELRRS